MGKRHAKQRFMPGVYVFPGGRIEGGDRRMNVSGALPEIVEHRLVKALPGGTPGIARALALAAIRETFEETGLLLGDADCGTPDSPPEGAWTSYAAHGVYPCLDGMHLIARAVTPPRLPMRFDTVFFAIDSSMIVGKVEGVVGPDQEFVDLQWIGFDELGELPVAGITRSILIEMEKRLEAGMSFHLPVPNFGFVHQRWIRQEI